MAEPIVPRRCPICDREVRRSDYLRGVFRDDEWAEFAACCVTHYRHDHINYYDSTLHSTAYARKNRDYNGDYDEFKARVNNRAKRQLLRAAARSRRWGGVWSTRSLAAGMAKLQHNDAETIALIEKILHHRPRSRTEKVPYKFDGPRQCRWCGKPLPKRRQRWCSNECGAEYFGTGNRVTEVVFNVNRKAHGGALTCEACGRQDGPFEDDHKVAIALGGDPHDLSNRQVLCRTCHVKKTAQDIEKIRATRDLGRESAPLLTLDDFEAKP